MESVDSGSPTRPSLMLCVVHENRISRAVLTSHEIELSVGVSPTRLTTVPLPAYLLERTDERLVFRIRDGGVECALPGFG